jgi:dethiobiotin synthetase
MLARGVFITGTDTNVGKTYVASLLVRQLREKGLRVGVYKPAASGCVRQQGALVSEDALSLWQAAGQPGTLAEVCPQCFEAPLAPHLAARAEGRELNRELLLAGIEPWRRGSDFIVVEGAGGLLSPVGDDYYIADLAAAFQFPLIIVAANRIGVINQTLQTLHVARTYARPLTVAGVILNQAEDPTHQADASRLGNAAQLLLHGGPTCLLGTVDWGAKRIADLSLAGWCAEA